MYMALKNRLLLKVVAVFTFSHRHIVFSIPYDTRCKKYDSIDRNFFTIFLYILTGVWFSF